MASFPPALRFTLANEGFTYVHNPHDLGGSTKMGITIGTLSRWLKRPATPEDVKALTVQDVTPIYRTYYWNVIHGDIIADQAFATVMFDAAVLCGTMRALQMYVDASSVGHSYPELTARFCDAFEAWVRIVAKRPTQAAWLPGWLKRVQRCRHLAAMA